MNWLATHLLSLIVFLPMAGALLCAALPRSESGQHKAVALVTSIATFCVSLLLWTRFGAVPALRKIARWSADVQEEQRRGH